MADVEPRGRENGAWVGLTNWLGALFSAQAAEAGHWQTREEFPMLYCLSCGSETMVKRSFDDERTVTRLRECKRCGFAFTTTEMANAEIMGALELLSRRAANGEDSAESMGDVPHELRHKAGWERQMPYS